MKKPADNDHPIHELTRQRWSPRAFTDKPVEVSLICSLVESARWSPSAMNEQPWRFFIGIKGDTTWEHIYETLIGWNQQWAKHAPVLLVAVGKTAYETTGKDNYWWAYDTGQAMAQLTLEATHLNLSVHQMGGFDQKKIIHLLNIPEGYNPLVVAAIGYPGNPETLPEELRKREFAPRERKSISQFVYQGTFGNTAAFSQET